MMPAMSTPMSRHSSSALISRTSFSTSLSSSILVSSPSPRSSAPSSPPLATQQPQSHQRRTRCSWCHSHWNDRRFVDTYQSLPGHNTFSFTSLHHVRQLSSALLLVSGHHGHIKTVLSMFPFSSSSPTSSFTLEQYVLIAIFQSSHVMSSTGRPPRPLIPCPTPSDAATSELCRSRGSYRCQVSPPQRRAEFYDPKLSAAHPLHPAAAVPAVSRRKWSMMTMIFRMELCVITLNSLRLQCVTIVQLSCVLYRRTRFWFFQPFCARIHDDATRSKKDI